MITAARSSHSPVLNLHQINEHESNLKYSLAPKKIISSSNFLPNSVWLVHSFIISFILNNSAQQIHANRN